MGAYGLGMMDIEKKLVKALAERKRKSSNNRSLKPAAVLLLLYKKDGEYRIIFTRRTRGVEHHKGEISFPGGRYKEEDRSLDATALRECAEEVGVNPADVRIIGVMDDEVTISSNYYVTPFVAIISYLPKFKKNRLEVEEVFEIPLSELDKNKFREKIQTYKTRTFSAYFYQHGNYVIWGATARILKKFLDLLYS